MTDSHNQNTTFIASKIARVQGVLQGVDADFQTEINDLNEALQALHSDLDLDTEQQPSEYRTLLDCPKEDCPGKRVKKEDERFSCGFRWECSYCNWRQDG